MKIFHILNTTFFKINRWRQNRTAILSVMIGIKEIAVWITKMILFIHALPLSYPAIFKTIVLEQIMRFELTPATWQAAVLTANTISAYVSERSACFLSLYLDYSSDIRLSKPYRIWTYNLLVRSQVLCSIELMAHRRGRLLSKMANLRNINNFRSWPLPLRSSHRLIIYP